MLGYPPSRLQLFSLDVVIVLLQCILTVVAYETSLAREVDDDATDPLVSRTVTGDASSPDPDDCPQSDLSRINAVKRVHEEYIIDLRLSHILMRLRTGTVTLPDSASRSMHPFGAAPSSGDLFLPMPNTMSFLLPRRRRSGNTDDEPRTDEDDGARRIPGDIT
ncbi:hypothetical protein FISHEDRAFT_68313 [Fistulina hepatica ATCC 64428]|uniref:DUF1746 domain-containing protein n=1 Tax=Fistulina hepatica ATCC 64428 TaxID=1128425 RepID=A0A0D7AT01_9AGAR|nr:hypothetical protein FISHEDRAFT_68313 [Fistulina hepatica ATCC 64428]